MTQAQLFKHLQFCKFRYNGYGEDVFQGACLIALQRYKTLDNVNQSLFSRICKEAARTLLRHRKYEITFSQLQSYEDDEEKNFEDTLVDPRSTEALMDAETLTHFDFNHFNGDFVSLSYKEQLPLFQLTLPFTTTTFAKQNHKKIKKGGVTWTWRGTPTPTTSHKSKKIG
jgi:hypothetical protein